MGMLIGMHPYASYWPIHGISCGPTWVEPEQRPRLWLMMMFPTEADTVTWNMAHAFCTTGRGECEPSTNLIKTPVFFEIDDRPKAAITEVWLGFPGKISGNHWVFPAIYTGWWFFAYPSEKYEFVTWDDEIPNWMESHKFMFQTTNQYRIFLFILPLQKTLVQELRSRLGSRHPFILCDQSAAGFTLWLFNIAMV